MKFKRIKNLREDNDYTQEYMAKKLKINRVVYNRYENGIRDVPIDILIELSKIYNVNLDYITEKTNIKNYNVFLKEIEEIENKTSCDKCKKIDLVHCDPNSYLFICENCGQYKEVKSDNYSKN